MAQQDADDATIDVEKHSATYRAVDPVDLQADQRVIVDDVTSSEPIVEGEVVSTAIEWGRVTVTIDPDGDGEPVDVSEETGRTWTVVEADDA